MKNLVALAAGTLMASAMLAVPVYATTDTTTSDTSYGQHAADCLALLFTNPKLHEEECGGPYHDMQAPPSGTTGYGPPCHEAAIDGYDIYGDAVLVAGPSGCCYGALDAPQGGPLRSTFDAIWTDTSNWWLVTKTAC
ncbi:MAG TPA: hypothetical protein VHB68_11855 [Steroidobacteraceae bacterium]|nr:hypothetical protein [Steroidobacteraceae bacterium]